eukprot:2725931-Pleurochrysis_carterae.AAC.1
MAPSHAFIAPVWWREHPMQACRVRHLRFRFTLASASVLCHVLPRDGRTWHGTRATVWSRGLRLAIAWYFCVNLGTCRHDLCRLWPQVVRVDPQVMLVLNTHDVRFEDQRTSQARACALTRARERTHTRIRKRLRAQTSTRAGGHALGRARAHAPLKPRGHPHARTRARLHPRGF